MNITFLCRKSKCDRSGYAPIEASLVECGERTYVKLSMRCEPEQFSVLKCSRRGNWLKEYLGSVYLDLQKCISKLSVSGKVVSVYSVKECYLKGIVDDVYTISSLKGEYLEILKERCSYPNWRKYEMSIDLFISIVGRGVHLSKVSNGDIMRFQSAVERRYDGSTSYSYLSRLKSFFRYAIANGRISVDPFYGMKLRKGEKKVEIIGDDEYQRIRDKEIGIPRVERVRDLFILAANCGLSYSDICGLSRSDFSIVDGRVVIDKCRIKTGVRFYSVVLPDGIKILEKYGYDVSLLSLSNQKANLYLKEIAGICGIGGVLTFHKSRHYYITRLVRMGVDISIVQLCAGHSNLRMTQKYLHLVKEDVVRAVSGRL